MSDERGWTYKDIDDPFFFIQWKGTDVCFDFHCKCGGTGHFDGGFAYFIKCTTCGRVYESPFNLILREIPASDAHFPVEPDMENSV